MLKRTTALVMAVVFSMASISAYARYESRFEVINFDPAVDGGNYFTVYDSSTHDAWQGNLGVYFDYANRPLQIFVGGIANGRQSIVDHMIVADVYGSLGFTDWFTAGLNIPVVGYNWFITDDINAAEDNGGGVGDLEFVTKFRIIDIEKHKIGFALVPFVTLPTGDVGRYTGNGHVTGGMNLALDFQPHERFTIALNLGGVLRDDVTRNITIASGVTGSISLDDQFTYGAAANYKISDSVQAIVEAQGSTVIKDFFQNDDNSPFEVDGGIRYLFNNSGFAATVGGGAGLMDGIGNPRFRAFAGLNWTAPKRECEAPPPPPDPRIVENKIILMGKIFFDTDKATIKPQSYAVLDDVVDVLNKNPQVTLVEIQGHTDWRASDAYNQKLSEARANSARNYLISKGIDPSRLQARGFGETQPIAPNTTVEGMAQNRRTEFTILEQNGQSVPASNTYIPSEPTMPSNAMPASPSPDQATPAIPTSQPVSYYENMDSGTDAVALAEIKPQEFPAGQTAQIGAPMAANTAQPESIPETDAPVMVYKNASSH